MTTLKFILDYLFVWFLLGVVLLYAWLFLGLTYTLIKVLISKNEK